jgi:hypothetical protein
MGPLTSGSPDPKPTAAATAESIYAGAGTLLRDSPDQREVLALARTLEVNPDQGARVHLFRGGVGRLIRCREADTACTYVKGLLRELPSWQGFEDFFLGSDRSPHMSAFEGASSLVPVPRAQSINISRQKLDELARMPLDNLCGIVGLADRASLIQRHKVLEYFTLVDAEQRVRQSTPREQQKVLQTLLVFALSTALRPTHPQPAAELTSTARAALLQIFPEIYGTLIAIQERRGITTSAALKKLTPT